MIRNFTFTSLILWICLNGCVTTPEYSSPESYQLNDPEKSFFPESLNEVSGISFYRLQPDTIYAIQDELGRLYELPTGSKQNRYYTFGKTGDYEDLSIAGETVYVLKSNGHVYQFPFQNKEQLHADASIVHKHLVPKGEYESLFADAENDQIIILAKKPNDDDNAGSIKGFRINIYPNDSLALDDMFLIDVQRILKEEDFTRNKEKKIRPSAVSKHPITGEWYILASVNKLLIICDSNWNVQSWHHLSPKNFKQPEGICFDLYGNMYISNEGNDVSVPTLLKFPYSPK